VQLTPGIQQPLGGQDGDPSKFCFAACMGQAVVAGSLMAQLTENNRAASIMILPNVFFMVFSPREAFLASQHQ